MEGGAEMGERRMWREQEEGRGLRDGSGQSPGASAGYRLCA